MAISLKETKAQLDRIKAYLTTAQANAYIRERGTCGDTKHLDGKPLSHYRCEGSCSWTASGR